MNYRILVIGIGNSGSTSVQKWATEKDIDENIFAFHEAESVYGASSKDNADKLYNIIADDDVRAIREKELVVFLKQCELLLKPEDTVEIFTKRISSGNFGTVEIFDTHGLTNQNPISSKPINKKSLNLSSSIIGDEFNHFTFAIDGDLLTPTITISYIKSPNTDSHTGLEDSFLSTPLQFLLMKPSVDSIISQIHSSPWHKYIHAETTKYDRFQNLVHVEDGLYQLPDNESSYRIEDVSLFSESTVTTKSRVHTLPPNTILESVTIRDAKYTKQIPLSSQVSTYVFTNVAVPMGVPRIIDMSPGISIDMFDLSRFPVIELNRIVPDYTFITVEVDMTLELLNNSVIDTNGHSNKLYGARTYKDELGNVTIRLVNNVDIDDIVEYTIDFKETIDSYELLAKGVISKGYIKNINQRENFYYNMRNNIGIYGEMLKSVSPKIYNAIMEIPIHEVIDVSYDERVILYINYAFNNYKWLSAIKLPKTVQFMLDSGIDDYNIVEALSMALVSDNPNLVNFDTEYNTLLPMIIIHNPPQFSTSLCYSYLQSPQLPIFGTYKLNDGTDKFEFNDTEYYNTLIDELMNENKMTIMEYISAYQITDIVILGAYADAKNDTFELQEKAEYLQYNQVHHNVDGENLITLNPNNWNKLDDIKVVRILPNNGKIDYVVKNRNTIVLTSPDTIPLADKFPIFIEYEYYSYQKDWIKYIEFIHAITPMLKYVTAHFSYKPFIKELHDDVDSAYNDYLLDIIGEVTSASADDSSSVYSYISSISVDDVTYQNYTIKEYINPFFLNLLTNFEAIDKNQSTRFLTNVTTLLENRIPNTINAQSPTIYKLDAINKLLIQKGIMFYHCPQKDNQCVLLVDSTNNSRDGLINTVGTFDVISKMIYFDVTKKLLVQYQNRQWDPEEVVDGVKQYITKTYTPYLNDVEVIDVSDDNDSAKGIVALRIEIEYAVPKHFSDIPLYEVILT